MSSPLALYIPNPERAVGPAIIQLVLISILAAALYAYLRPRCGRKATIKALLIGELVSFLPPAFVTLVVMLLHKGHYGDTWRGFGANHSDPVLILTEHFELYRFAIWSFLCLLGSALILSMIKTGDFQHEFGDKPESPPSGPDSRNDAE